MLGKNIKNVRKSKKMTQEMLAIKLNVTRQTISKWENGLSIPDASSLEKLAEAFGISVQELMGKEMPILKEKELDKERTVELNKKVVKWCV